MTRLGSKPREQKIVGPKAKSADKVEFHAVWYSAR